MKSPVTVSLSAVGVTPWVSVDYLGLAFGIGLGFSVDSNASGITAKVQHTFDEMAQRQVTFSQAATTVTITDPLHGLITGDTVTCSGSGPYAATSFDSPTAYSITVLGNNTYSITVTPSQTAAGQLQVVTARPFDHASMTGMTARTEGNYAFPVKAIRLNVTALAAGRAFLQIVQGIGR